MFGSAKYSATGRKLLPPPIVADATIDDSATGRKL